MSLKKLSQEQLTALANSAIGELSVLADVSPNEIKSKILKMEGKGENTQFLLSEEYDSVFESIRTGVKTRFEEDKKRFGESKFGEGRSKSAKFYESAFFEMIPHLNKDLKGEELVDSFKKTLTKRGKNQSVVTEEQKQELYEKWLEEYKTNQSENAENQSVDERIVELKTQLETELENKENVIRQLQEDIQNGAFYYDVNNALLRYLKSDTIKAYEEHTFGILLNHSQNELKNKVKPSTTPEGKFVLLDPHTGERLRDKNTREYIDEMDNWQSVLVAPIAERNFGLKASGKSLAGNHLSEKANVKPTANKDKERLKPYLNKTDAELKTAFQNQEISLSDRALIRQFKKE